MNKIFKKFKFLLPLATSFSLISIAASCDFDLIQNKENQPNNPQTPTPEKGQAENKQGQTDQGTAADSTVTPSYQVNTSATIDNGNNIFEVIPNLTQQQIDSVKSYISRGSGTLYFLYNDSGKIATKRRDGVSFIQIAPSNLANNTDLRVANDQNPKFAHKNRGNIPDGNISYTYDPATTVLTLTYKVAIATTDETKPNYDNGFYYSEQSFTTQIPLTFLAPAANNNAGSNSNSGNNNSGSRGQSGAVTPIALGNKRYVYETSDYYASANGLKGKALLDALLAIQKSKLSGVGTYDALKSFYKTSTAFKDKYYEKDNTLLDIYSENPNGSDPYKYANYIGGSANVEGLGTNREHLIPKSWFNQERPMHDDANHVWPTDIKVNAVRSNYPHGKVVATKSTSRNGGKLGTNAAGMTVFEPIDVFKGDIARTYLYFTVTYSDRNLRNGHSIFTSSFPYIQPDFLTLYRSWSNTDSVDQFDIDRNNATAQYQTVRNPFIDYPDLADCIFGDNPKVFVNKGILKSVETV
ncbi:endonuclease [Mycoplasma nasistruthionis]|uniref:Uncharacterized protein n=1 Tax=Mycoplasma nasistruthionis TaxID=353852 RepID=A0A4Y6I6U2_9MOLU|nr:endonuclease [Mycoplasma nasistruthionis]QDF65243.1 hypothetical protein FIV53_03065 [Mycoplasma nasistruthionis]